MHDALATLAVAVVLGVCGQGLASLTRLPAIVFLLLLGLVSGPYGLNLIQPAQLGSGLPVLTSAFVAIILFEGGLTLHPRMLAEAMAPVRRLITIGAALTLVGAAVLAHFLQGLAWPLAFSFAALIVVTGPTVIAPILRRVRLRRRLHAILKSESILIDPIGVFIAVIMFQYVVGLTEEGATWTDAATGFLLRVGIGGAVGAAAGLMAALLARLPFCHQRENEHLVCLGALGVALAAYALAEHWQMESGVMAAIVAGLILAAVPLPFREELEKFKDHLTTLGVSVLFILLAGNLNLALLAGVGWREAALLAGLMLVVRPVAVFLSTIGTRLHWREQAYLALLAPRGIMAAAMASYFAEELGRRGLPGGARVELLVFLTIAATVCIQGSWAALLARILGVQAERPRGVLLVGVSDWSLLLADQLGKAGHVVLFLDNNSVSCDLARERGYEAHQGDAADRQTYEELDLSPIGTVLAMTPNDAVNTLACEAARSCLADSEVLQVVSKPMGGATAPRVRLAGRRALPTEQTLRDVVRLLQEGQFHIVQEIVTRTGVLGTDGALAAGVVPLLVCVGGRTRIAVEGDSCPVGALVVGLSLGHAAGDDSLANRPLLAG